MVKYCACPFCVNIYSIADVQGSIPTGMDKSVDVIEGMEKQGSMKKLCILVLLCICTLAAFGAEQKHSYTYNYLASYPGSGLEAIKSPLIWQGKEWLTAGAIVVGASALYMVDEDLRDFAQSNDSETSKAISLVAKQFGEGKLIIPIIGASILGGYILDSPKTMDTGLLSLKSFILSQTVTQSLKLGTQRNRPSTGKGKEFWNGRGIKRKRDSFPSGHSTIAWSLAPIFAEQYGSHSWVAPVIYTIAGITSLSRVHDNNHWSSDVFVGAVIGYYSAKLTLKSTPRLQIAPDPIQQNIGIYWNF